MLEKPKIESREAHGKKYLYHMVPEDMAGNVLHPLNKLRDISPELYLAKAQKYVGRKGLMELVIPTLKCKWNDVVHLSPIHPAELKALLSEAGIESKELSFYQIDPDMLDPIKTTVYLYNLELPEEKSMGLENFADYNPNEIEKYSEIPAKTKEYYLEQFKKEKHSTFLGIPHILHKGPLDISDLPVITV